MTDGKETPSVVEDHTQHIDRPLSELDVELYQTSRDYEYGSASHQGSGGDSDFTFEKTALSKKTRSGWQHPPQLIDYDPEIGRHLISRVNNLTMYEAVHDDLLDIAEPVRSTFHSFLVDLWMYDQLPTSRKMQETLFLMVSSLVNGPIFAAAQDEYRSRVLGIILEKEYLEEPEYKYSHLYNLPVNLGVFTGPNNYQVGDIYRPNCLFRWRPPTMDYVDVIDVPVHFDPLALQGFRMAARKYLTRPKLTFWEEIPFEFVQRPNGKKHKEGCWALTPKTSYSTTRGKTRIVDIARELKECRWACLEDPGSVLAVQWIEKNVSSLIDFDGRNYMRKKPATILKKLYSEFGATRSWKTQNRACYCRDFKKEGLTKPRELIHILMEELTNRFPLSNCFRELVNFYDDWQLENIAMKPLRGHGLGMAVALTTLMQLIIEEMLKLRTGLTPHRSGYVNDDAFLIFDKKTEAKRWAIADAQLCQELSLMIKKKATFISTTGIVMCEVYNSTRFHWIEYKHLYDQQEWGNLFKACNVAHARQLAETLAGKRSHCEDVLQYWGPILYRDEFTRPRELGGWFRHTVRGVDLSWYKYNSRLYLNDQEEKAMKAYQATSLITCPWDKRRTKTPYLALGRYADVKGLPTEIGREDYFRSENDPVENRRRWNAYLIRVRKKFDETSVTRIQLADLADMWQREDMDILPPYDLCNFQKYNEVKVAKGTSLSHPYSTHRMDLEVCQFLQDEQAWDYVVRQNIAKDITFGTNKRDALSIAWLREQKAKTPEAHHDKIVITPSIREYLLYQAGLTYGDYGDMHIVPPDRCMGWRDPFAVCFAVDQWIRPAHSIERVAPADRKHYYGRELTVVEWVKIGSLKPVDQIFVSHHMRGDPSRDLDEILRFAREYPGFGLCCRQWFSDLDVDRLEMYWKAAHDVRRYNPDDYDEDAPGTNVVLDLGTTWNVDLDDDLVDDVVISDELADDWDV